MENSMKSSSTINAAIMENTECLIVKVRTSFIDLKVRVLLNHGVSLRFIFSSWNMLCNRF